VHAALLGVRAVLAQAEWLYVTFKLLGGAYLCYLAWRLWRGGAAVVPESAESFRPPATAGLRRSFWLALATQLSNPKTLIVISGILAALLPAHIPGWMYRSIPVIDLVLETSWYVFVAVALSSTVPRQLYLRASSTIDRAAECVLGALGLRLIFEGAKESA
jgi:threonine/homoserine/homoserine lactone efflux protein